MKNFEFQSLALKGPSTAKFREKGDEVPTYKNLLLWMVRLIHADPMLMLNVRILLRRARSCEKKILMHFRIKARLVTRSKAQLWS